MAQAGPDNEGKGRYSGLDPMLKAPLTAVIPYACVLPFSEKASGGRSNSRRETGLSKNAFKAMQFESKYISGKKD